ncbi:MAG: hypothetical protein FWF51_05890 [Chitinivibrionia bacterium]|nr:hypothetical protein [Chitinivibrionia bacterium]
MLAYQFDTVIENEGVIRVPSQYLGKVASTVKVILLSNEESLPKEKKHFSAMKLKTQGFKFDRKAANERKSVF